MLIPLDKLRQFYDRILQNALDYNLKGAATVQIFVTNETDSLCSLKILTSLFKSDELQYIQTPVFNNDQLRHEINQLKENKNIRSIIFINCGGVLNQTAFWYYNANYRVEAFIFDSHRPFSHMNLYDPQSKIYIIHDGCKSFDQYPTPMDYQDYQNYINSLRQNGYDDYDSEEDDEERDPEEEDDLNDEDDEEKKELKEELDDLKDSDDEEDVYGGAKVKKSKHQDDEDDEEQAEIVDANHGDDLTGINVGAKRGSDKQEGGMKMEDQRKLKRQKRMMVKNYYNGYFYHKCSAYLMYQVCQALNRENKEALWLWIVGMTDLKNHYKQQVDQLEEDRLLTDEEVQRLNPNIYNQDNEEEDFNQIDDEDENGDEENKNEARRNQKDLFKLVQIQSRNFDVGTITITQELKLMLLRHWSLFESIMNSNYTVTQLKLWKEPGRRDLHRFLATVGISLDEAKQNYSFMNPQIRRELKTRILKNAQMFEIQDIIQNTYLLQLDQKTQILATDMAYSLTAILESPRNLNPKMAGVSTLTNSGFKSSEINNLLSTRIQGVTLNQNSFLQKDLEIKEMIAYQTQSRYDNFYVALDALERKNKHLLDKGIELARELQMAIIQIGTSIIEKKQIKSMDRYRYCFLEYDMVKDIELFHFPQALQKLALFLQSMHQRVQKTKAKPFVLSVRNNKKGTSLVVTVLGNSMEYDTGKNNFNQIYREIIKQKTIRASTDSFDTSVIEINNEDVQPFFDEFVNQYGKLEGSEAF